MKHKINLVVYILLLWQLVAVIVNKEVIVPYPLDVFQRMIDMLTDFNFYQTLFITLSHVIIVVAISALIATTYCICVSLSRISKTTYR